MDWTLHLGCIPYLLLLPLPTTQYPCVHPVLFAVSTYLHRVELSYACICKPYCLNHIHPVYWLLSSPHHFCVVSISCNPYGECQNCEVSWPTFSCCLVRGSHSRNDRSIQHWAMRVQENIICTCITSFTRDDINSDQTGFLI